jgi:hypothetical protein
VIIVTNKYHGDEDSEIDGGRINCKRHCIFAASCIMHHHHSHCVAKVVTRALQIAICKLLTQVCLDDRIPREGDSKGRSECQLSNKCMDED